MGNYKTYICTERIDTVDMGTTLFGKIQKQQASPGHDASAAVAISLAETGGASKVRREQETAHRMVTSVRAKSQTTQKPDLKKKHFSLPTSISYLYVCELGQ